MKLMHPNSTQTIDVSETAAQRYASQGWREVADDETPPVLEDLDDED